MDYLISCVEFVAEHGHRFVKEYHFDARDGRWPRARELAGQGEVPTP